MSNFIRRSIWVASSLIRNRFPRRPTAGGPDCPYDTHSVDLTLGPEIAIPDIQTPLTYDLIARGRLAQLLADNSQKVTLAAGSPFVLDRHTFILARTRERISLPILDGYDDCLSARIEGKSSMARIGLLVHFTAPTVHPGFDGTLTLEIINLGPARIPLQLGMPIAQLIVEEVRGKPLLKSSQFHGQSSPEGTI